MGGCLAACCLSELGLQCHSIISTLGLIYFLFIWLIFDEQVNFFEFHLPDREESKLVSLVCALICLMFLVIICGRLVVLSSRKQSKSDEELRVSVHELRERDESQERLQQ